jgi:hypothetical protein
MGGQIESSVRQLWCYTGKGSHRFSDPEGMVDTVLI